VDDVTLTENLASSGNEMQLVVDRLAVWSNISLLKTYVKKLKKLLAGPIANLPTPLIELFDQCIERAPSYKLLGV
jgi:hypothetical protein